MADAMDPFQAPFWNLDQLRVWALSRDAELVRAAAIGKYRSARKSSMELVHSSHVLCEDLKTKTGRDIEGELWGLSGFAATDHEPNGFPIITFLSDLFGQGRLVAYGNKPGEVTSYKITPEDWAALEIAVGGDEPTRLGVWRRGLVSSRGSGDIEAVRVSRDEILKLLPSERITFDLDSHLRDAVGSAGGYLPQETAFNLMKAAAEKVGAIVKRKDLIQALEVIQGTYKTGPKGPRKNRAMPSA